MAVLQLQHAGKYAGVAYGRTVWLQERRYVAEATCFTELIVTEQFSGSSTHVKQHTL